MVPFSSRDRFTRVVRVRVSVLHTAFVGRIHIHGILFLIHRSLGTAFSADIVMWCSIGYVLFA